MMRLSDLRHADHRTPLVWVLASLLFAQTLFPIQLHTRLLLDSEGEVVQVCTLQGVKTIVLDPATGEERVVAHDDDNRSPACAFSQLLGAAMATAATVLPGWLDLAPVTADPIPASAPSAPVLRHTPIRAPPALV